MKEEYKKWHSNNLSADFELLAFGHSGYPILLFPTSMGRYFENKDFKMIESIQWFIDEGKVKVYCIDSIDGLSWYNKGIHPADRVKKTYLLRQAITGRGFNNGPSGNRAFQNHHCRM